MKATTVAVGLAKAVFQLAVADEHWRIVETQRLTRTQVEHWFFNRIHPIPTDADNSSGSLPAVRSDWRTGDANSMSARTTTEPTKDAGYTTAGASPTAKLSVSHLPLRGSPHTKC